MKEAAKMLEFEYAAVLRDQLNKLREEELAQSEARQGRPGGAIRRRKGIAFGRK